MAEIEENANSCKRCGGKPEWWYSRMKPVKKRLKCRDCGHQVGPLVESKAEARKYWNEGNPNVDAD